MVHRIKGILFFSIFIGATVYANQSLDVLRIDSESMQFNNKTGLVIHKGQVVVHQGETTVFADIVTIQRNRQGEIESLIAEGSPAKIVLPSPTQKAALHGAAKTIDYQTKAKVMLLTGEAMLNRGADTMQAEMIEYHMQNETILAKSTPGTRTRIVLQPQQSG